MTIPLCYIGCDVSKRVLDIHDPATGGVERIVNSAEAITRFANTLLQRQVIMVFEATGAYDRALRTGLASAGVSYVRVNPTRARRFAQAAGLTAKTDAIDARMLSAMGEALRLEPDTPDDARRAELEALQVRRDQLVQIRADEKKRAADAEGMAAASIASHIDWLDDVIETMEIEIERFIAACEPLRQTGALLRSMPGLGPVTIQVLLAQLPELGHRSPKAIAALAGLAPMNHDSGTLRGQRRIKAGRKRVRRALYMASLSAIRSNTRLAAFFTRIKASNGSAKAAIIATARKLLTILNAMVRESARYKPSCS